MTQLPPPGWYPDPAGTPAERYWDGNAWSQVTREAPQPAAAPNLPVAHGGPGSYGPATLAGWGARALAFLIDGLLWFFPVNLLQSVILGGSEQELDNWLQRISEDVVNGNMTQLLNPPASVTISLLLATLVAMGLWMIYRAVMVALFGGTVGQLILQLRVVRAGDHSLAKLGWGRSILRAVAAVVLFNITLVGLVNALVPLFTPKQQTLHDMIAGTVVIKK